MLSLDKPRVFHRIYYQSGWISIISLSTITHIDERVLRIGQHKYIRRFNTITHELAWGCRADSEDFQEMLQHWAETFERKYQEIMA